jgi:hypothetical protein
MLGNNKEALQIVRISIPFFSETGTGAVAGQKYFFPEHPEIDKKTVVGIELHCGGVGGVTGVPDSTNTKLLQIRPSQVKNIFFVFKNENNEYLFENVPALSLYTKNVAAGNDFKQSIQPYFGKIKTRSCYAYFPANTGFTLPDSYLNLTFYLR